MVLTSSQFYVQFSSIQSLSNVWLFATPWTAARQASLSYKLLELTQTHVHSVHDVIQPSHPLSSLSPPAFSLSQHQGLFQWVSSLHQVAKYCNFSFIISPSNKYSGFISFRIECLMFLLSKGLSRVFSNTTVQKHQFFSTQLSLWSNSHINTWLVEKP